MCHQVVQAYLCGHSAVYQVACNFPGLHQPTQQISPSAWSCSTCAASRGTFRLQNPINIQAQPMYFAPTFTQPQIVPQTVLSPSASGTPLPVPSNVPRETRFERINGTWQPVVHYHFNSTPASSGRGFNPIHGYDNGSLPPGWASDGNNSRSISFAGVWPPPTSTATFHGSTSNPPSLTQHTASSRPGPTEPGVGSSPSTTLSFSAGNPISSAGDPRIPSTYTDIFRPRAESSSSAVPYFSRGTPIRWASDPNSRPSSFEPGVGSSSAAPRLSSSSPLVGDSSDAGSSSS